MIAASTKKPQRFELSVDWLLLWLGLGLRVSGRVKDGSHVRLMVAVAFMARVGVKVRVGVGVVIRVGVGVMVGLVVQ